MSIRLLIADDHLVVRMGLIAVLSTQPDFRVVAQAEEGTMAVSMCQQHRPDVAILDVRMPRCDGIIACTAIRKELPAVRVLMLTTYDTEEDVHRALAAGANGYLLKDAVASDLVAGIRAVHAGDRWLPDHLRRQLAQRDSSETLTARQIEVLAFLAKGLSNRSIGVQLAISEDGVKAHIKLIFQRLRVSDRTEAVGEAIRRGILRLEP